MYTEVFESQNQAYKILLKHVFNKELITKGKKTEQHKNVLKGIGKRDYNLSCH